MRKEFTLIAIAVCAITLAIVGNANEAEAAAFMKLGDIKGEATDANHAEWVDLLSFSHSIHRQEADSADATRRRGDVIVEDITLVKELDKSSPKLAEAVVIGQVFPVMQIQFASSQGVYFAYELKNVMITSVSISGDADSQPTEQISLNFEEIKVTYTEYDTAGKKKGNVEYSWKVEEGES